MYIWLSFIIFPTTTGSAPSGFHRVSDGKRSAILDDPPDINSLFDWIKLYLELPTDILSAGDSVLAYKKNDLVRRFGVSKHYKEYRKAYQSSKTSLTMISLHVFRSRMTFTCNKTLANSISI